MVADVSEIIHAGAFAQAQADAARLPPLTMGQDDIVIGFAKAHIAIRLAQINLRQIDHPVGKLRAKSSEKHAYTSCTLTCPSRQLKSSGIISWVPSVITLAAPAATP